MVFSNDGLMVFSNDSLHFLKIKIFFGQIHQNYLVALMVIFLFFPMGSASIH